MPTSLKDPAIMVLVSPASTTTSHDDISRACAMLQATIGVSTCRLIYHAHVAVSPPLWRRALGRASPSPLSFPTDDAATSAIETLLSRSTANGGSTAPSHEPFSDPSPAGIVQVAAEGGSDTCGDRYVHVDGGVAYHTSVAHTLAALPNVVGILVLPQGGGQSPSNSHWYSKIRNTPIELLLDTLIAQGGVGVPARMGLVRRSRLPVPTLVMRQSPPPTTAADQELSTITPAPLERGGAVVWIDGQHFIGQPTAEVEACSRVLSSHVRLSTPTGATLVDTIQYLQGRRGAPLLRVLVSQPTPVSTMYSTFSGMEGAVAEPPSFGDVYGGAYGDGTRRKVVELNAMSAQLLAHIVALSSKAVLTSHSETPATKEQTSALSAALKSVVVAVDPLAVPEGVVPGFGGRCLRDYIETATNTMPTSAVVLRAHPVGGKNRWTKAAVRDANCAITSTLSNTVPLLLI